MTVVPGPAWLVVPATDDSLAGAAETDADALVVNLAVGDPRAARAALDAWLNRRPPHRPPTWVQLAAGDTVEDDVQVVLRHSVAGICLTGATTAAPVAALDALLGGRRLALVPIVGSGLGLLSCGAMAALARVPLLGLDEAALVAELRMDPSPDEHELASVRGHVVVVSAAFGLQAPVGGPPGRGASEGEVRDSTDRLRRLGYGGRAVTDPSHVAAVRAAFG